MPRRRVKLALLGGAAGAGTTFIAICLLPQASALNGEITDGYMPYHELRVEDFRVDDTINPEARIYTAGFFRYTYEYDCAVEHSCVIARVVSWTVRSGFDWNKSSRKSWSTPSENDLAHEQGHLDINEIYSRQLREMRLDELPIGEGASRAEAIETLNRRLAELAEDNSKSANLAQRLYDAETAYGQNELTQRESTTRMRNVLDQPESSTAAD